MVVLKTSRKVITLVVVTLAGRQTLEVPYSSLRQDDRLCLQTRWQNWNNSFHTLLGRTRVRMILVLGYWVLGDIHRYWIVLLLGDIFCSDT